MKHARKDYDRIQDPENKIPEDEPVFLLRGQDVCTIAAITTWIQVAKQAGVSAEMIDSAEAHLGTIKEYQRINGYKIPDMPHKKRGGSNNI